MKKKASRLAIVMTLMLVFSMLFASMGVFAVDPEPDQGQQLMVQNVGTIKFTTNISNCKCNIDIKPADSQGNYVNVINDQGEQNVTDKQIENAGYTSGDIKNKIRIQTAFLENIPDSITINGVAMQISGDKDNYEFEVDASAAYDIKVTGKAPVDPRKTIIWGNPGADIEDKDAMIGHGTARVMAVYDQNGNLIPESNYNFGHPGGVDETGYGHIVVMPGSKVVFEFVPEYGYQLTHIAINEMPLTPQETTNQFSFLMPETNVHFSAIFTRTSDVVNTGTTKVRGGTVDVANNLDGGTAQLTVKDVELSADKIQGFQNAAGAYNVSQYLDIDLYNVFYKGKNDASDVWSNKIDELPNEATISLQLADGVNANDIVLVHNIHDGETFEVIPVESYDAATNTITFKTKSFSNYAIATKDGKKGGSKGPGTGDDNNIIPDLVIMITAGLALAGIGLKRRFDR